MLITSSFGGILIYLLLIAYQPFGTSQFEHSLKYLLLLPYALIGAFAFFIVTFLSFNFFGKQSDRKWTTGLELVKVLSTLTLIAILSYFYNTFFLSKVELSFENFLYMLWYSLSLGMPISVIYMLGRYVYFHKRVVPAVSQEERSGSRLSISADYGHEPFELDERDFLFAEAADNYCVVYFCDGAQIAHIMLRISLVKLSEQLQTDSIKRVHRSYIVNLRQVKKYKGNASGYHIMLENVDRSLCISRKYVDSVLPVLKSFAKHP